MTVSLFSEAIAIFYFAAMKFWLVLSALLAIGLAEERFASVRINSPDDSNYQDSEHRNVTQLVHGRYSAPWDHFSPTDPRLWRLFYHANFEYYRAGGPIFIYFGIDGLRWLQNGLVFDLARQMNGAIVASDPRYFGLNRWKYEKTKFCNN